VPVASAPLAHVGAPDSLPRGRTGFATDFTNLAAASARARGSPDRPESGAVALPISYSSAILL